MDRTKAEHSFDGVTKFEVMSKTHEVPSFSEVACSKKIKPRAIIFKADDKDLHKIKELIETQFPKVEIICYKRFQVNYSSRNQIISLRDSELFRATALHC